MINLDIKIRAYRLLGRALRTTEDEEKLLLIVEHFSHYVLSLYGSMVEESINSRRYKGKWEPIDDPGYLDYLGAVPKLPIIYLIKDALEVKRIGYNFIIRINPRYKYPGSKLTLVKVLRAIDSGTSDFNARPIFSKIVRKINSNILDLWKGYLKMKGVL